MNYKNKRILFSNDETIPNYKEDLMEYLKEKFGVVDHISSGIPLKKERSIYFKLLRELAKKGLAKKLYFKEIEKYCQKVLGNKKDYFDYFFVVAGAEFSSEFLKKLREINKGIKCIIFLWDKLETTSLRKSVFGFDKVYTFDKEDAERYGFNFLHSFFINNANEEKVEYKNRENDLYFIGALRSFERYKFSEVLNWYSKKNKLNSYIKLLVNKKNIHNLPKNYQEELIIRNKISYLENLRLEKNSKVMIELPHGNQIGLTLRTIESIATETKLITTNKDIMNYDFYNSENIFIIKDEKDILNIPRIFFEEPYKRLDEKIVEKYSVKGFIDTIFNDNI